MKKNVTFAWDYDMFHYMFKAEFVRLSSLKVPSCIHSSLNGTIDDAPVLPSITSDLIVDLMIKINFNPLLYLQN